MATSPLWNIIILSISTKFKVSIHLGFFKLPISIHLSFKLYKPKASINIVQEVWIKTRGIDKVIKQSINLCIICDTCPFTFQKTSKGLYKFQYNSYSDPTFILLRGGRGKLLFSISLRGSWSPMHGGRLSCSALGAMGGLWLGVTRKLKYKWIKYDITNGFDENE